MGIHAVRYVSDHWAGLPMGPYKLLIRMAAWCLDESDDPSKPPLHYWRGWKHLAEALDREPPPDDDFTPEAVRRRKTIQDEIRRHTNTLVKEGAVARSVDNPGRGTRQVWKIQMPEAYGS